MDCIKRTMVKKAQKTVTWAEAEERSYLALKKYDEEMRLENFYLEGKGSAEFLKKLKNSKYEDVTVTPLSAGT